MHLNHIHLRVRDLEAAVAWFEKVFQISPGFQNEQMATFCFDSMTLIFDAAKDDVSATVGFESDDCDRDFRTVVQRGAIALELPTNKQWGCQDRVLQGAGRIKVRNRGARSESLSEVPHE